MKNVICILMFILIPFPLYSASKNITFIHTNDLHSHLLGFSPTLDYSPETINDDKTLGGWARISTFVRAIRASRKNPVYVVDAGDFLMGSLFHLGVRETGFELNLLQSMGVDVTTIGNHELDFGPDGLAQILESAKKNGAIPEIVSANMAFSKTDSLDDKLEEYFKNKTIKPYLIREQNGIKIGFFGVAGVDAGNAAPFKTPIEFLDAIEVSKKIVNTLRKKEKVDIVVALSHSGIWEDGSISEDEILADKVDGIDIIISGHTPERLKTPKNINDTIIVHTGMYGDHVGVIDIVLENHKVKMTDYKLSLIDDTIPGDPVIQGRINDYLENHLNKKVLQNENLHFWQVIAKTDFELKEVDAENNLGNLVADSIRWYINQHIAVQGDPSSKVDFVFEINGVIRDDLLVGKTGNLTVSDIFNVIPLGAGMDKTMGYPLLTYYVTAQEIKDILEVMTSVAPIKTMHLVLQISGIKFTYNPNRMIFDRVTQIFMEDENGTYHPLDYSKKNKKLYKAGASTYVSALTKLLKSNSMGVLNVIPKDKKGNPILDLKDARVDRDKNQPGVQELKEWLGIINYMRTFPDIDGDEIPDVPEKYRKTQGRSIKVPSWNPVKLLAHANAVTWIALSALLSVAGIFVVLSIFL